MTHNFFAESMKFMNNPAMFGEWFDKFSKVDWAEWHKKMMDEHSHNMPKAEMMKKMQEMMSGNFEAMQRQMLIYLEGVRDGMSATAPDQALKKYQRMMARLALENSKHLKEQILQSTQLQLDMWMDFMRKFEEGVKQAWHNSDGHPAYEDSLDKGAKDSGSVC